MINKLFGLNTFSTESIILADAMETSEFLDTNINKTFVSRDYKYRKEEKLEKITLFKKYEGKEYEGKYFLQDIAYEYRLKNRKNDDLLLFLEDIEDNGVKKLRILAISTFGCFDKNLSIDKTIKKEEDGSFSQREISKIKNILNNADFTCDRVVIFSDGKNEHIDKIINESRLRLKKVKYLTQKEIFAFFKTLKPFEKSDVLKIYLIGTAFAFAGFLVVLGMLFESDGLKELHENTMTNLGSDLVKKDAEFKKVLKTQERLFMETSNPKVKFIPGEGKL